eukprot:gb/GECH01004795.1/.p1 GENE.gb/GECH01004795.1/~~gb/GECH01004795.1/.p1  ORF type:complete len:886 (+),score=205.13 gb/GECH01004795.1/:1-2658(+)
MQNSTESSQQKKSFFKTVWKAIRLHLVQCKILLKKNILLQLRNWKTTLIQLLSPLFFVIVLFILQQIYVHDQKEQKEQPFVPVGDIPKCIGFNGKGCYTLLYTPQNHPQFESVIHQLAKNNQPPLSISSDPLDPHDPLHFSHDIVPVENSTILVDFIKNNPNVTQSAVVFDEVGSSVMAYDVMYNSTKLGPDVKAQVLHAMNKAIVQDSLDDESQDKSMNVSMNISSRGYPQAAPGFVGSSVVAIAGGFWFYCPPMLNFIVLMNQIVTEKELKLRLGMKMMGLKDGMFWLSWLLTNGVLNFLSTVILILSGFAFRFDVFINTNPVVNFLVFFTFSMSVVPLAFLCSTFISKAKTANTFGFVIFVFGLFLQILFTSLAVYFWYLPSTNEVFRILFIFYPPFNFAKAFGDVSTLSAGKFSQQKGGFVSVDGYGIKDLFQPMKIKFFDITAPATIYSLYYLLMNFALFVVVTWYLDNVLPQETGTARSPWFFLTPSYWGWQKSRQEAVQEEGESAPLVSGESSDIDADVQQEINRVLQNEGNEHNDDFAIRIVNLCKTYQRYPLIPSKHDLRAVDNFCLSVNRNSVLCLLGHNGAGKTTTINMLTGLFAPTSGTAWIGGFSIATQMDQVRRVLGVCPQHDILWSDLTAKEHLQIFAEFKGVPSSERKAVVEEKLRQVELFDVRNNRSKTFSGGMKRRLSVAIASIGDPAAIFFDEPTTGLDPVSKRRVWDLIDEVKKDKAVILTTHSMEEADILSDRIAIMAHGHLRCIGTSLHLKNKFGVGYHITLVTDPDCSAELKEFVSQALPDAQLSGDNSGSLQYTVPHPSLAQLGPFLRRVEKIASSKQSPPNSDSEHDKNYKIKDWGVSHTTLEEVFIRITQEAKQLKKSS